MRNNFFKGFLSGLAASFFIVLVGTAVFYITGGRIPDVLIGRDSSISPQAESSVSGTYSKTVGRKIQKMESLIDKYFLEEADDKKLTEGIYKGMLQSLGDPYSVYYTKEEFKDLMEASSGVYYGIGSTVTQNIKTGVITFVKPFLTGPAYKAGILPGDILYMIEEEQVTGRELTEVVSMMKGKEGTKVKITVIREGKDAPLEFAIVRQKIEVPTIEYEMLEGKIGYISIAEFEKVTDEQFRAALKDLEKQGQKGLIIDVRNNPGGLLEVVVDILDRMLPEGLIVYTEDKNGKREEERSSGKEKFSKPLVVLINGNSASASEIFAGAIQDYGIGTIVGTTTYGKGIVQSVIPLYDNTAIKITVSRYFTPKGRNIHGTGITPDVEVELDEKLRQKVIIEKEEDNQLQQGLKILKNKLN